MTTLLIALAILVILLLGFFVGVMAVYWASKFIGPMF